jgi:hypothetical protein
MKMAVSWDVAPHSVVAVDQIRGASIITIINHPDDGGSKHLSNLVAIRIHRAACQKTTIFILIAVRTSRLMSNNTLKPGCVDRAVQRL